MGVRFKTAASFNTVNIRQVNIEQNQVRDSQFSPFQTIRAISGNQNSITVSVEKIYGRLNVGHIIFNNQDSSLIGLREHSMNLLSSVD
jgi:hypothetical protein